MSANTIKIGDRWYRVDGRLQEEACSYEQVELDWEEWRAVKITPAGAWFLCSTWPYKKRRFVLAEGSRKLARTKADALQSLIARKIRQIKIVQAQAEVAANVLALARKAAAE